jgi:hypothetical protein
MRRLGILAAAITLLTAAPASAETFTVTTPLDSVGTCPGATCTIRAALAAAVANGRDTEDLIVVPANTYQLASELTVDSRVVIRGAGARTTTIRGNRPATGAPWRAFDIAAVQATIESLTMENGGVTGENGGNLRNIGGTVLLDHVRVTNGLAPNGGGIANEIGSMTIRYSLIDTNPGGGIFSLGGNAPSSLIVHDSTVALNTGAGGIRLVEAGQPSTGRLERVTVVRNQSGFDPGGIAMDTAGAMRVRASIISGNEGDSPGAVDCSLPLPASEGANLETEADCGFIGAGDVQNAGTAGLSAALANAGGQTDVFTLAANSPAVNRAGACAGADQRDLPRPQGGACDSGAYEFDLPPDTQLVATPPTFTFSSSEPGVRFECRLDRPTRTGTPFACTSPASFPNLPPGSYTFVVRAIDGAGQADPSPAATAFAVQVPRPNAGKSVVVNRVRGKVLVKVPGGRFVDLSRITEIPDGSIIDTREGVVVLVFEPRRGAKTQKAKFWDGIFKVDQRKRIMELSLVEKLAKCRQQGDASAAAKKKKRRLWGDGKGRFRTRGQYSSATVRGTKWLTQDSCAGTLTKVRKGKVDVRDFVRKLTIRVKKGQQYLARPG